MPRKPARKSRRLAKSRASRKPAVPTEHDRFDYSAIIDRPRLEWPNGARVAVWMIPNIEHFLFDRPSTRLTNLPVNPDVLNYSWRDYGVRVGVEGAVMLEERSAEFAALIKALSEKWES